ncbi:MAG: LysM peptidoglycan-binding domain-containing protein [Ruminiclostridium sp.]|nr:LysM peptidoglycan-binding domain-containing protein [Ruminiclostridium sp.]
MPALNIGSTGPDVKLVQSLLNRIGYNAGPVDGYFGSTTRQAVIAFQRNNGLTPDGIVGPTTWAIFDRLLRGYDTYTIKSGDTLYRIAARYHTTLNAIITANPGINPNFIYIGQKIIVPYGLDIVFDDIDYTYEIMERQIQGLKVRYPFLETGVAGKSVMGKNVYYIRIGKGGVQVSYNASHHANEAICTPLLMKFTENFCKAFSYGRSMQGYDLNAIFNRTSMYIIPMVNPDGVDLVAYWPNYTNPAYTQAALLNKTGRPLPSVWKANIKGVDLNLNYPALWDREKQEEIAQGITEPAPRDFGGDAPLSEPESRAMYDFTRQRNFRLVIAYHTQGEVIYWQFQNMAPPQSLPIARQFGQISGYGVVPGTGEAAYAGYKDWFIQDFGRPGYTIEVGRGANPIPMAQFPTIYRQNEGVMLLAAVV